MICTQCRHELTAGDRYCGACGAPQEPGRASHWQSQKLARSRAQRRIAGVCGGIAEYLGVDVTFIRTAWVVLSIVPGAIIGGIIAYLLAWLVMPERSASDAPVPLTHGSLVLPPIERSQASAEVSRNTSRSTQPRSGSCGWYWPSFPARLWVDWWRI